MVDWLKAGAKWQHSFVKIPQPEKPQKDPDEVAETKAKDRWEWVDWVGYVGWVIIPMGMVFAPMAPHDIWSAPFSYKIAYLTLGVIGFGTFVTGVKYFQKEGINLDKMDATKHITKDGWMVLVLVVGWVVGMLFIATVSTLIFYLSYAGSVVWAVYAYSQRKEPPKEVAPVVDDKDYLDDLMKEVRGEKKD